MTLPGRPALWVPVGLIVLLGLGACGASHSGSGAGSASGAGGAGGPVVHLSAEPSVTATATFRGPAVTGVTPGHDSPLAAAAGFLDAALAGDVVGACTYIDPNDQPSCAAGLSVSDLSEPSGPLQPGNVATSGTQALVTLVGSLCTASGCYTNQDPNDGLPRDQSGFAAAWKATTSGNTSPGAAGPEVQMAGKWYVYQGS